MTAPRVVPPEGPEHHLRNALALLGGLRATIEETASHQQLEIVGAISRRIWAALQHLEGTK